MSRWFFIIFLSLLLLPFTIPVYAQVGDADDEAAVMLVADMMSQDRPADPGPAMERHIEWSMRTHIGDTARITGKPTGECIGLAQSVGQSGVHKPEAATPVESLYLVGCDAGARGVGTEQAAASALYVAGLIG